MSAGKTVEAHRASYNELFGSPRGLDSELLRRFGEIRRGFAQRKLGEATLHDDAQDGTGALLVAFLEEPDLESALRRARGLLEPREHAELARILAHFAPKYERIWEGGGIPRRFVERLRGQARLEELTALLVRIAEFFRVDPASGAPPHLILVPVRGGHGTHAQANGRHLLIELRPDDGLDSTASVIVHENVHLLMHRIDGERMRRLEQRIRELDAEEAGRALREALPTALGQGVADRRFRREWNRDRPWYHIPQIDRYAKRIFPLVERAIAGDGRFDEELLEKLLALYPG